jgi:hypothetical protein
LELDNRVKQLMQELGRAINDSVAESPRVADVISGVRAAGFEIVVTLDARVNLARRGTEEAGMTSQDLRFLESMRIRVDEDVTS